ncbi:MAG: UDP-3-O-acyl-N-acetylglucosamine deacetylase, partial [Kiritimatiellaeota bacterium]|nr:UDP-3-O-acyl-N-acetylglucosamine deacetylase [Kiritimatiellota bacterium]
MSYDHTPGKIIHGDEAAAQAAFQRFLAQPVDREFLSPSPTLSPFPKNKTTIAAPVSVSGPATFKRGRDSTLNFLPCKDDGWWINRTDQPGQFPFKVSVRNVWTTALNIVLRSGSAHNYLRMVEHIIALRVGMGVDKLMINTESGDPPLFDRGNLDLVEAIERAGIVETDEPAEYSTVRETVTFAGARGDFLTFIPAKPGEYGLRVDCAVDFPSAIGKQRIVFDVTPENFRIGASARTNAPYSMYLYTRTVGKLFADTRNLGYTTKNILIHGKRKYLNEA